MTVTIMYGKCDSKLNARERRRIKEKTKENHRLQLIKQTMWIKLFALQTRKDANQIALKNVAKEQQNGIRKMKAATTTTQISHDS